MNTNQSIISQYKAPSKLLLLGEWRSVFEMGAGLALCGLLHKFAPRGVGQPVLVLPGLGANDLSTKLLRVFLNDLGFVTYGWELGINKGFREDTVDKISYRLDTIYSKHQAPVSIVGQSLGGIFAREVAKIKPQNIRQVITLGSPFTGDIEATNAQFAYKILSGQKIDEKVKAMMQTISQKPPVPTTSIFSKFDGIVSWECSIEKDKHLSENIEILGASHIGMASSPQSLYLIADRLSQPEKLWRPFEPIGIYKTFYKKFD